LAGFPTIVLTNLIIVKFFNWFFQPSFHNSFFE
jgi:hypothetical protein